MTTTTTERTTVGTLHVHVETTAAGSESEYLPDCYRPLFNDAALRRPAFTETKRRMMLQQQQQESTSAEL